MRAKCPDHLILGDLCNYMQYILYYAILFNLVLFKSFLPKYSSEHPSEISSVYILLLMSETKFLTHTKL
jgi:hypothetical protein